LPLLKFQHSYERSTAVGMKLNPHL